MASFSLCVLTVQPGRVVTLVEDPEVSCGAHELYNSSELSVIDSP